MSDPQEQKDIEAAPSEQKRDFIESAKVFLKKTHTINLPGWAIALMGILIIALIFD
jgi:hypothetical protein